MAKDGTNRGGARAGAGRKKIYQVVKENCSEDYRGANPQEDVMERLLRTRMGH
jgi:hypothetical protein